jgi:hypothetical protein
MCDLTAPTRCGELPSKPNADAILPKILDGPTIFFVQTHPARVFAPGPGSNVRWFNNFELASC